MTENTFTPHSEIQVEEGQDEEIQKTMENVIQNFGLLSINKVDIHDPIKSFFQFIMRRNYIIPISNEESITNTPKGSILNYKYLLGNTPVKVVFSSGGGLVHFFIINMANRKSENIILADSQLDRFFNRRSRDFYVAICVWVRIDRAVKLLIEHTPVYDGLIDQMPNWFRTFYISLKDPQIRVKINQIKPLYIRHQKFQYADLSHAASEINDLQNQQSQPALDIQIIQEINDDKILKSRTHQSEMAVLINQMLNDEEIYKKNAPLLHHLVDIHGYVGYKR